MGTFVCLEKWDGFGTAFVFGGRTKKTEIPKHLRLKKLHRPVYPCSSDHPMEKPFYPPT